MKTRPIFVATNNHIDAHLLTCFLSLMVLRMIQYKMGKSKIPSTRIKKVLEMCTCQKINDLYVHLDTVSGNYEYEKVISKYNKNYLSTKIEKIEDITRNDFLTIQKSYEVDFDKCYIKINEFNKELKRIKYKVKTK